MQVFRQKSTRYIVVLITGITFFNLSFFQAEIMLLDLDKDSRLIGRISLLLSVTLAEEEGECNETTDADTLAKILDLISHQHEHQQMSYHLIVEFKKRSFNEDHFHAGYYKEFCPPPEA
jgi:hypothetical protein